MNARSKGFTLIELIIVIVILGILAVTVAPKFIDVGTDARVTKLRSFKGSIISASNLVHYQARIENKTDCNTDPTVLVGDQNITLRCGYPCPHPAGIASAIEADDDFTWVGGNCAGRLGAIDVQLSNATDPSDCKIRYAAARTPTSGPIIEIFEEGC